MVIYKAFLKGYYNSFSCLNRLDLEVRRVHHLSNKNSGHELRDDIHNERDNPSVATNCLNVNHSKLDNWLVGTFSVQLELLKLYFRLRLWLNGLAYLRQFHPERN